MSKRGSPYLRKALFRATFVASNTDLVFKVYHQKTQGGQASQRCGWRSCRKILLHYLCCFKNNLPYEVQALESNAYSSIYFLLALAGLFVIHKNSSNIQKLFFIY